MRSGKADGGKVVKGDPFEVFRWVVAGLDCLLRRGELRAGKDMLPDEFGADAARA